MSSLAQSRELLHGSGRRLTGAGSMYVGALNARSVFGVCCRMETPHAQKDAELMRKFIGGSLESREHQRIVTLTFLRDKNRFDWNGMEWNGVDWIRWPAFTW